jgi:hypothetical protein
VAGREILDTPHAPACASWDAFPCANSTSSGAKYSGVPQTADSRPNALPAGTGGVLCCASAGVRLSRAAERARAESARMPPRILEGEDGAPVSSTSIWERPKSATWWGWGGGNEAAGLALGAERAEMEGGPCAVRSVVWG